MSEDDNEVDMITPDGTMRVDRTFQRVVTKVHQAGPGAVAQELCMRDLIIAKLLTKLGVDKIDLHSMNDSPPMRVPLQVSLEVGGTGEDAGRIVTVSFRMKKSRMI